MGVRLSVFPLSVPPSPPLPFHLRDEVNKSFPLGFIRPNVRIDYSARQIEKGILGDPP